MTGETTGRDQPVTAFREDLQGLRAIAVLMVVIAHAGWGTLEGGFVGVDVFFVLSGYLITGILARELVDTGTIDLLGFYARRLRRLLPALLVMVLFSFAAAAVLLSVAEARSQLASSPYAVSWTSNLFFALRTVDYFDELAVKDLFLHTWSLGVEEQFYLFWPAFLLGVHTLGTRLGAGGERWLLPGVLGAAAASLVLCLYWTAVAPEFAFYMMPARIWQLSLGALVYLATSRPGSASSIRPRGSRLLLGIGLTLIIGSGLVLDNHVAYPGYLALFPSLGASLVILAGASGLSGGKSLLAQPLLVWLGDRSYSFYLWHWPVLILGYSLGMAGELKAVSALVLLALLLSMLSYRLVEYPFWRGRWSRGRTGPVAAVSVLVIAAGAGLAAYTVQQLPEGEPSGGLDARIRFDIPELYSLGCDTWFESDAVQPCIFGDPKAARTAVIIGDSIGLQWFSVFPEIYPGPDWRVIVVTKSSCPIVDETYFYNRIGRDFKLCDSWREQLLKQIGGARPEVIVVGSASTYPFSAEQWRKGSERAFAPLSAAARAVFVIPGTPVLGFDGPGCLAREIDGKGFLPERACRVEGKVEERAPVVGYLQRAAIGFDNVHVLDLNDLVCPDGICRALSAEGVPVYRDGQHLTDSFVRSLVPRIKERMEKLFPIDIK